MPTPTTTLPFSSNCLMGVRLAFRPARKVSNEKLSSSGSIPRWSSSLRAQGSLSAATYITAPKRRGSCSRSRPLLVCRSKWSCVPAGPSGASWGATKRRLPDMPRCSISRPSLSSISRYLPRRRTPCTSRPASSSGAMPNGQRKGLPKATDSMRAPAICAAKARRVTSTSGNSGMRSGLCCSCAKCVWASIIMVRWIIAFAFRDLPWQQPWPWVPPLPGHSRARPQPPSRRIPRTSLVRRRLCGRTIAPPSTPSCSTRSWSARSPPAKVRWATPRP